MVLQKKRDRERGGEKETEKTASDGKFFNLNYRSTETCTWEMFRILLVCVCVCVLFVVVCFYSIHLDFCLSFDCLLRFPGK